MHHMHIRVIPSYYMPTWNYCMACNASAQSRILYAIRCTYHGMMYYVSNAYLCYTYCLHANVASLYVMRLDSYKSANNMYKSFLSVWVQFMCGYFQTKNIFCISSYVQDRTIWSSNDLDITDLLLLVSEDITHPIYTFVSQVAQLFRAHTPDMYAYWLVSSLDSCSTHW